MAELEPVKLLKAEAFRALGSKIAYNFNDMEKRCEDYLQNVRNQTRQMILDAQQEAEKIKQDAFEAGKQQGHAEAQHELETIIQTRSQEQANRIVEEKLGAIYPAMQAAVEGLQREQIHWRQTWDATAVEICLSIAEKMIRHELKAHPESVRAMMGEALKLASGTQHIRFHLNPADVTHLGESTKQFVTNLTGCQTCEIFEDESISSGGCFIETQHGTIDATLEAQLDRISQELVIQTQD
ncbi:FliH/SctL family protein [Gimesia fumaroli]|uniref:Flagellar assembly protein FliH n=1 Tax=Gimesia fumaroli TaxID=2527976 RepID=A0A518IAQ0_9PLAN|nr:FliH/SctL family protein [Gimesia fumaroli]QDV50198.1 flagellar assembly protein H [Gimesia fumaroli]